jgi:hypothetical protein
MATKKKFIIETLNTHFNGVREGLQFKDGKAVTTDEKLAKLLTNPGDHRNYFCAQLDKPFPKDAEDEGGDNAE